VPSVFLKKKRWGNFPQKDKERVMAKKPTNNVASNRQTVMGPFLADMRIGSDADELYFDDDGQLTAYRTCNKSVPGGVFQIFLFGDAKKRTTIPVMFEVKTKDTKGKTVHYGRAEVSLSEEKPTHKVYVGTPDDEYIKADPNLPDMLIEEHGRRVRVCFVRTGN
jgi:hypothetical protein